MDAATFNQASLPFAARLSAAMTAFGRDPADVEGFETCWDDIERQRRDLAMKMIGATGTGTGLALLGDLLSFQQAIAADVPDNDDKIYSVKSQEKLQAGFRDGIKKFENIVERLKEQNGADAFTVLRSEYTAVEGDQKDFIAAGRRVLKDAAELPPRFRGLARELADLVDARQRFSEMFRVHDEQQQQIKTLATRAVGFIGKMAGICNISEDYVRRLKEDVGSCTDGTPEPVTIRRPLTFRKATAPTA